MPRESSRDLLIPWADIEAAYLEFLQAKIRNRHDRNSERLTSLGAELATLREFYLRQHARHFPADNSGPRCWQQLTDQAIEPSSAVVAS